MSDAEAEFTPTMRSEKRGHARDDTCRKCIVAASIVEPRPRVLAFAIEFKPYRAMRRLTYDAFSPSTREARAVLLKSGDEDGTAMTAAVSRNARSWMASLLLAFTRPTMNCEDDADAGKLIVAVVEEDEPNDTTEEGSNGRSGYATAASAKAAALSN